MSTAQRPSRRLSARLQEKGDAPSDGHPARPSTAKDAAKQQSPRGANARKRKNAYDEEDDGFTFSRVRKKGQRRPSNEPAAAENAPQVVVQPSISSAATSATTQNGEPKESPKRRRNKMTFSTPNSKAPATVRRSKRLSDENEARRMSPPPKTWTTDPLAAMDQHRGQHEAGQAQKAQPRPLQRQQRQQKPAAQEQPEPGDGQANGDHSTTKIALPFADTPVIRRNKEMRENKSGSVDRRSSLGMRGRRASSLIETGNSNALPHAEVEVRDFYKHIEADGLPEPRRMRQLLTWCATRAMDQKAMGGTFEEASAVAAARVMEEELLKDLSNRSELSDWFTREDEPPGRRQEEVPAMPERPNPKNVQNAAKIVELEGQIKRLRAEKESLEALLRPPSIPKVQQPDASALDSSLLSDSDKAVHQSLAAGTDMAQDIASRLNAVRQKLGPTVDLFASSVHSISQYRDTADEVATRVLSLCAQKLEDREKEGRRRAAEKGADPSPRADLTAVLRGLSRVDADA
ncbi:hypothetical protein DV737_g5138, partial [Chaetothyriales sp. CBS 132003]